MEAKLENLIEKIKQDGVEEAERQSKEIIAKAKNEASEIVNSAKNKAKEIAQEAEKEAEKFKQNAESAIQQAARDLVLLLKERIRTLFDSLFKMNVSETFSIDFLKELIVKIVVNWGQDSTLEVLVSDADKQKLQELVFSSLKKELRNTIILKTDNRIHKGFRIGIKGEEVYYDLTDEGILEFLKQFLSPSLSEILD